MEHKKFFIIWISLLAFIILALVIVNTPKKGMYATDKEKWIKTTGAEKEIDVEQITEGTGFVDAMGQQLRAGAIETVFDYEGYYKGNHFKREYKDENGDIKIRINPNMNPNDGIIEGFIIEKLEDDKPVAYIFLDEDWKNNMQLTNIFWGKGYEYEKTFTFTLISNGVYMNKIDDDASRFSDNYRMHAGGIIVGDITRYDDVNKTVIRLI